MACSPVLSAFHAPVVSHQKHSTSSWEALKTASDDLIRRAESRFDITDINTLMNALQTHLLSLETYSASSDEQTEVTSYITTFRYLLEALQMKKLSIVLFNRQSPTSLPSPTIEASQQLQRGCNFSPLDELLGEGCFGVVRKTMLDTLPLAAKTVIEGHDTPFHDPAKLLREGALLMALSHRNIIAISGCAQGALILQFADQGSLYDHLHRSDLYTHRNILHILTGLSSGLAYMHNKTLTHCDLHWGNVGLSTSADGSLTPIILDFELASLKTPASAADGNLLIQSPEALRRDDELHHHACKSLRHQRSFPHVSVEFGKKCYFYTDLTHATDIWSLGMIAFSLVSGGKDIYSLLKIERRNFLLKTVHFSHLTYLTNALALRHLFSLGLPSKDPLCVRLLTEVIHPCFARNSAERPTADALWQKLSKMEYITELRRGFHPIIE